MQKRTWSLVVVAIVSLFVGVSSIFAQDASCTACHNDTTVVTGRQTGWSESMHGTGEAYGRGTRNGCAGCHSGGAFSATVAAGLTPDTVEEGDPNPTRQDCRACHQIHTRYTGADWALETTARLTLYAFEGVTYDGGKGNLCANCHQPRRTIAAPDAAGNINVSSSHWGPHHGPQGAMLLGVGSAFIAGRNDRNRGYPVSGSWFFRQYRDARNSFNPREPVSPERSSAKGARRDETLQRKRCSMRPHKSRDATRCTESIH